MVKFLTRFGPAVLFFVLAVAVSVCVTSKAQAQTTTANIEGTVLDEKGNPAADVEVVARNEETGYYQIVITSANGKYRVNSLTPGSYMVRASHVNYNMLTKKNIQLGVGQTAVIDFTLTSKDIQQKEIVVEGYAPLIDTKKSDLSVSIRSEQIQALPLNSRNFLELAAIAPGAKSSTGGRGPVTTGALNSRFISAYIDGGEFKSDGLGGALGTSFGFTSNLVPEDAIREFQVITSLYKAEYSKASNGVINAVTKSGTNEIHGTAFSFFRMKDLNAQGVFEAAKPDYNRQQFGVSIGGPIMLDRTHFFVSYERNSTNNFLTVNTGGAWPALDGTYKSPTTQDLLLARVTHTFSPENSLDVRWLNVNTQNTPGNFGGAAAYSNGFNLKFTINSIQATDRWLINNNTVNELRVHYQHYIKDASPVGTDPAFVYQSSGTVTGWNANQPQIEDYQRLQIRDDISLAVPELSGSHVFKGGVNFEREPLASKAEFNSGGVFTFTRDTSSLPFRGALGVGDASTSSLNYKFGIYVQDDWTVLPNLTLNLGLRWDVETQMIGNNYNLWPAFAADTALTNNVPANYIGKGNRDINYGAIAPRIGFAWDVMKDKSTVIHGGWGLFYDRIIYNVVSNEIQNGKYNTYTVTFGATAPATTNREVLRNYILNNQGGASAPVPAVTLLPNSVPIPYTSQFTVGVSHELSSELAASLDYVMIRGSNEYTTYNVNYTKGATGPRAATSKYGGITLLTSDGQSWYDGVQLSLSKPYRGDWQMQLSYTLSWAYNTFDDPFQGYVFKSSIVKTYSQQDERHRFVLSGIVNLPYDFQLSGVMSLSSPRPITATTGTDDNVDGATGDDYPGVPADETRSVQTPTCSITGSRMSTFA
jgi:hypothetical protein